MSENMPGGSAIKPGDILTTPSGKTVEVLNTDAEGRLVLADALTIAVGDGPDVIVDIATLTGAVRSALGNRIAGIMGNDRALIAALTAAGKQGGERCWELPLVRDYRVDLDSDVADLANVAAGGYGGAIHAGLFLEEFVGGLPWAHLDIAGVGFTDRDIPNAPRGGVGFGTRMLARYALAATER
jgi:leucyl aminopeptidase